MKKYEYDISTKWLSTLLLKEIKIYIRSKYAIEMRKIKYQDEKNIANSLYRILINIYGFTCFICVCVGDCAEEGFMINLNLCIFRDEIAFLVKFYNVSSGLTVEPSSLQQTEK